MDRPQRSLIEDEQLEMAKALLKEELQAKAATGKMHQVDCRDALRRLDQQSLAEVTQAVKAPLYEELRIAATVAQTMDQRTWYAKAEQLKNQPVVEILQARAAGNARQDPQPPFAPALDRPAQLFEQKAPASPPRETRLGATLYDGADMVSVQRDAMRQHRDRITERERQASTQVAEQAARAAQEKRTPHQDPVPGQDGPPQARAGQEPNRAMGPAPDVPHGANQSTLPPDLARYAITRERHRQPGRYDALKALPEISPLTQSAPEPKIHSPAAPAPWPPAGPPPFPPSAPMLETPAEPEAHAQVHVRRTQQASDRPAPTPGHTPETATHTARLTPEVSNSAAVDEREKRRLILEKARQGRDPLTASAQRLASLEAGQQRHDRDMERAVTESQEKVQRIAGLAQQEQEKKGQERTPETAAARTERLTSESRGGKPLTEREKRSLILQEARERHGIRSPSEGHVKNRER